MRKALIVGAGGLAVALLTPPAVSGEPGGSHPPLSSVVESPQPASAAAVVAEVAPPARFRPAEISIGENRRMVRGDVINPETHASGPACFEGDQTPQNETSLAMNPTDPTHLVGGANDYRVFIQDAGRYDASGFAYISFDRGRTWINRKLPGLQVGDGGIYQGIGDPAVAFAPGGNRVYYANIAFRRTADEDGDPSASASAIAVSRSRDGGRTWKTSYVVRSDDPNVFHDKEWITVGPDGRVYVTWARFRFDDDGNYVASPIVLSRSSDGGRTWSRPKPVTKRPYDQFSVPFVDEDGTVYVSYESWDNDVLSGLVLGHVYVAKSRDRGRSWTNRLVADVNDMPSSPAGPFRQNSGPIPAIDGQGTIHIVWANFQGTGDIVHTRSTDRARTWSDPVKINQEVVPSDQVFPWIATGGKYVHVGFADRQYGGGYLVDHSYVVSRNRGRSWSQTVRVTTESFQPHASGFGQGCTTQFIGDYTAIDAASNVAQVAWTDGRPGNQPATMTGDTDDLDPYVARVRVDL